jgi:4-hydroxy-tetrahydrodipicolinate synthase
METRPLFEGIGVALVTPFRDGAVDHAALGRLATHLVESGVHALYPCGCTGEATSLTREERAAVIRTTIEAARGRAAVVAGSGTASTRETIELSREAIALGADAVMVISPYSVKPTQEGLIAHYRAVADAIDRPLVLYNVPGRTGVSLTPDTVVRLSEHPRIQAIKEASGSVDQASAIRAHCDIAVLAGDDSLFLPLLAVGARGVVSVAGHLVPSELKVLFEHARAGRWKEAERIHRSLHRLFRVLFIETNPGPVKQALELVGMIQGELRLPLVPVRAETKAALTKILESLEAAGHPGARS